MLPQNNSKGFVCLIGSIRKRKGIFLVLSNVYVLSLERSYTVGLNNCSAASWRPKVCKLISCVDF